MKKIISTTILSVFMVASHPMVFAVPVSVAGGSKLLAFHSQETSIASTSADIPLPNPDCPNPPGRPCTGSSQVQ